MTNIISSGGEKILMETAAGGELKQVSVYFLFRFIYSDDGGCVWGPVERERKREMDGDKSGRGGLRRKDQQSRERIIRPDVNKSGCPCT